MTRTIESILVPTDGSEGALVGARRGVDLAATTDADLHVLSVVDTPGASTLLSNADDPVDGEQLLLEEAEQAVEAVADLAGSRLSGRTTTAVEQGVPFETINEYADAHDIDLIVMGTQGRTGLDRLLLGSVAEKTLRTTSVPVVTVSPEADADIGEERYEDILLPTDGSEGAEAAIDWGITLADTYDGTIHTLYSINVGRFGSTEGIAGVYDALEQTGRNALATVRQRAQAADVSVAGSIASGPAARTVLAYTEEEDIDLVVMGTHGRSGIRRYLVGSVTETVVRNAGVPVCSVPME